MSAKDMLLEDAIKTAIEAEKKVIKLEYAVLVLSWMVTVLFVICMVK